MTHRPTHLQFTQSSLALMLSAAALAAIAGCASNSGPAEASGQPRAVTEGSSRRLILTDQTPIRILAQSVPDRFDIDRPPTGTYKAGEFIRFTFGTSGDPAIDLPADLVLTLEKVSASDPSLTAFTSSLSLSVPAGTESVLTIPISKTAQPTKSPVKYKAKLSGPGMCPREVEFEVTVK